MRVAGLADLAQNLWWSWHPRARMLYKMLNRQAWKESGHNPDKMLRELSGEIFSAAADDTEYLRHYHVVMSLFEAYMERKERAYFNGDLQSFAIPLHLSGTGRNDHLVVMPECIVLLRQQVGHRVVLVVRPFFEGMVVALRASD